MTGFDFDGRERAEEIRRLKITVRDLLGICGKMSIVSDAERRKELAREAVRKASDVGIKFDIVRTN